MDAAHDKKPAWRVLLEWGVVIYFLAIPLLTILTAYVPWLEPDFSKYPESRPNIQNFHGIIAALVATIAGLNTVDRKIANGAGKK